jgi:hypothetical protein
MTLMEIILIQNIHPIEINGGGGVYVSRRGVYIRDHASP